MTITPSGNLSVRALTLISAEDAPERDPSSFVIEGSNNGLNFTRIASNAVPAFAARHFIQSLALPGTNDFNVYRVRFPSVSNAVVANSMQIAEVELLHYAEITSTNDAVSIRLPGSAVDVRGVRALFDRQLGDIHKLEVAPIAKTNTVVDVTPAAGATLLKGFELIGAGRLHLSGTPSDERRHCLGFQRRRELHYDRRGDAGGAVVQSADPGILSHFEHERLERLPRYVWTPRGGDRLQVGEMRSFGEIVPSLTIRVTASDVLLSWSIQQGYRLERAATLAGGS